MKKNYLAPVMEYLNIQTSTICDGSGKNLKDNPMDDPTMPGGLAPRKL